MTLFLGAKSHFKTGIPIVSEIQQKYFGKRKGYISFLTSFVPSPIGKYIQTYNKNYIIQHSKYFHNLDFAADRGNVLKIEDRIQNDPKTNDEKIKVAVAMSGGVDSSVVAYLLNEQRQKYHIVGVHMQNWDSNDENGIDKCDRAEEDLKDVQRVCKSLQIPLHICNFVKPYWNNVFAPFLDSYRLGSTPNPDVLCNKEIKFNILLQYIKEELNINLLATGHYARISKSFYATDDTKNFPMESINLTRLKGNISSLHQADNLMNTDTSISSNTTANDTYENIHMEVSLLRGIDKMKDQSYFLSHVPKGQLKDVIFPLGSFTKAEVKTIAKKANLHNFDKKESLGICFIGKRKFEDFLPTYLEQEKGNFISVDPLNKEEEKRVKDIHKINNRILGYHKGISLYTIGQGAKISGQAEKYFVCGKNFEKNEIYVCRGTKHPSLYVDSVFIDSKCFNWISKPEICQQIEGNDDKEDCKLFEISDTLLEASPEIILDYQIRYRQSAGKCTIKRLNYENVHKKLNPEELKINKNLSIWEIRFHHPQRGVAKEQTLALYDGDKCLGGGIILDVGESYHQMKKTLPLLSKDWSI